MREGVRHRATRFCVAGIPIELPLQLSEETLVRYGLLLAATLLLALVVEQLSFDHIDQAPFVLELGKKVQVVV